MLSYFRFKIRKMRFYWVLAFLFASTIVSAADALKATNRLCSQPGGKQKVLRASRMLDFCYLHYSNQQTSPKMIQWRGKRWLSKLTAKTKVNKIKLIYNQLFVGHRTWHSNQIARTWNNSILASEYRFSGHTPRSLIDTVDYFVLTGEMLSSPVNFEGDLHHLQLLKVAEHSLRALYRFC